MLASMGLEACATAREGHTRLMSTGRMGLVRKQKCSPTCPCDHKAYPSHQSHRGSHSLFIFNCFLSHPSPLARRRLPSCPSPVAPALPAPAHSTPAPLTPTSISPRSRRQSPAATAGRRPLAPHRSSSPPPSSPARILMPATVQDKPGVHRGMWNFCFGEEGAHVAT